MMNHTFADNALEERIKRISTAINTNQKQDAEREINQAYAQLGSFIHLGYKGMEGYRPRIDKLFSDYMKMRG